MDILSSQAVATALPWAALVDRLDTTFRQGIEAPPRHHHAIDRPDGEATMLLMPAWEPDGYIGMKMVNVFPQNSDRGLPAISGLYLLCDGDTGQPLACMDGSELTRRRTAAASALAARYLARESADSLVVVGTGRLAPMLIEAHAAVRPIRRVRIWGRNVDKANALADEYRHYRGGLQAFESVEATENLASAVSEASLVSCATLSTEPLVHGDWLQAGTHLDLVGAFRQSMRETDAACIAGREVFVDTYAGAQGEAGDLHFAQRESDFVFADVRADLAELTREQHPGRGHDEAITVFKSVGASLEDLAAAIEVWQQVKAAN
ncbi:ornithine cyclodeaminase [Saccharospirillum sp. MSK14-1]|uniref:ornithine cyclodeaminase family protein n=1 Tax=Saccharospirillum sp. MSK14-1 TaxID=1897632 RepID=UPI000D36F49B|nr:ornithine cyclodeaminase family protein [Saccharospirillum sp. MSK14-1]PTY38683.1 ornithine cyclodeaminase [Saccharospirillum sp. MSK14-1]